jgi:uncharacterized protein (TIGR02246 family)
LPCRPSANRRTRVDPESIGQLQKEDKNFEEAYNKHDAAAIAALFTDDAVLVTPHGTFTGRAAIEKKYEEEDFDTYNGSDMVSTTERIAPMGNELHLTRRFRANYQSYGSFIRIEGNASPVFVLEGDVWKIRSETVEVTKKEFTTQSPTPTPSNR